MSHKMGDFNITQEDIDAIVRKLQKYHPEKATPEKAKELLENVEEFLHLVGHDDLELLEEFYKVLEKLRTQKE